MTINRSNPRVWVAIGLLSVLFHTYLIFSGLVPSLISRPLHLVAALPWIFLIPQATLPVVRFETLFGSVWRLPPVSISQSTRQVYQTSTGSLRGIFSTLLGSF